MSEEKHQIDTAATIVALTVMSVYALTMLAPYGLAVLEIEIDPTLLQTVKDNKNTVDLITTAVVMFFFGASVGSRKLQETVNIQAKTAQTAGAALPTDATVIPVGPDEAVTVKGKPEGEV